ncbi:MAG TPA: serine hydrolase [Bacteroidales bacterium]|nr:serine hydrolase [Bacteroidales bacterium]
MKKGLLIILFAVFLQITFFAQSSQLFNEDENPVRLVSPEMLDLHMVSLMNQYHISGMSAAIVKGGKTVWKSSYGYSNIENSSLVNETTSFLLYSVTKTVTGIGLMQLYQNGYFNLDDPINDYLPFEVIHPDYPDDQISFRMLMTHTSGIKDNFTVINSLLTYNVDSDVELSYALENYLVEDGEYYGENTSYGNSRPGTYFSYSNVGAALCGYLIECISGIGYIQYITDSILLPIGMTNSSFRISNCDPDNIAMEYSYSAPNYNQEGIKCNPFYPAGFLRSDINDMSEYLKMLLNGGSVGENSIISSDLLDLMMTEDNHVIAPNAGLLFGYDSDNELWGHNGGFYGVKTGLFLDKDEDWGVVVLSNGAGEPWQILFMLYQFAKDFEIFNATNIIVDDQDDDFILESGEGVNVTIKVRNNSDFDFGNIDVELASNNELINFSDNEDQITSIASGETLEIPLEFAFNTESFSESFESDFTLYFYSDDMLIDSAIFKLYFGEADVLLINDEEHVYRNRNMSSEYFAESIISAGKSVREYDLNLFGVPTSDKLLNFDAIVWFTGLDNEAVHTVLNENEQILISEYLDAGGKLFISSQNISDAVSGSDFMSDYLRAEQTYSDYTGTLRIVGIDTVSISDDLDFYITGGDGTNTQYSPSCVSPINGSELLFKYYGTQNGGGVFYDGDYKLVFLPFCFSSIDNQSDRDVLMSRILAFFDGLSGLDNIMTNDGLKIYPNPVVGSEIYLETDSCGNCEMEIIDLRGRIVYSKSELFMPSVIEIPRLQVGEYFIRLIDSNNSFKTLKIIISQE